VGFSGIVVSVQYHDSVLLHCNEGDSVNMIVKKQFVMGAGRSLPFKVKDSMMKVNVRVAAILDSVQLQHKLQFYARLGKDKQLKEQVELDRYLKMNHIPDSDRVGDIYFIPMIHGNGTLVTLGSRVTISYRGYFINQRIFDSVPGNDPMDFVVGDSG
jgi:FKBP-type peptidyl-prolyl cis-trans isomerase